MSESQQKASLQLIESFLQALDSGKLDDITSHFAPDAAVIVPLSITGTPEPWYTFEGIEAVTKYWNNALIMLEGIKFARKELTVGADANKVFFEAQGDMRRKEDGEIYRNVYIFRFTVAEGKITRLLEYANPVAVANFGKGQAVTNLTKLI